METVCQACGYQRKSTDQTPEWECPACGKAYLKTSHGSPRSLSGNAQNSLPESGEYLLDEGDCASYLAAHYGLPQTYRDSFLRRMVIPLLAMIGMLTLIALLAAMCLGSIKHALPSGWLIFATFGLMSMAVYYVASLTKRGMTIRADSIEIVQASSTQVIRARDILGYATDYVRVYRSSGWRYAFVYRPHGRPEERVYFALGPENLKDPRLLGLFRAMRNYGKSSLDQLLNEEKSGKLRMLDQFRAVMLCLVDIFIAWSIWPLILTMVKKA
ncbi:hypothetical protein [Dyella sp. A6]|uniref:hypothetical protein n=1 Tax=Dyella aluminiiresistens TaxID=3069105 RepID=UPI002E7AACEF|nr:hypothetical protein [Dyella sp. A6]